MGEGSWVGLDVHARSVLAGVIDQGSGEVRSLRTALVAVKEPQRRSRFAVRWLARFLDDCDPTIEEAALAASALSALGGPGHGEAGDSRRHGSTRSELVVELPLGAGGAEERERRRLSEDRIVCPVGTPSRPAEPAEGSALGAGCDVDLTCLEIPAARVHCPHTMRGGSFGNWPFGRFAPATSGLARTSDGYGASA